MEEVRHSEPCRFGSGGVQKSPSLVRVAASGTGDEGGGTFDIGVDGERWSAGRGDLTGGVEVTVGVVPLAERGGADAQPQLDRPFVGDD